ncbi:MAG: right-handed parallel beta-helix repeat-containing protein [Phycisphaerales bacterium]
MPRSIIPTSIAAVALAGFWSVPAALAATLTVPGDASNLQTAIILAADGDEIELADGTWTLSVTVTNKELTIRSASGDASSCFVNTNLGTAFSVVGPDANVLVEDITFNSEGRNIYGIDGARLRMNRCIIENAEEAGGIVFGGERIRLDECIVRNNINLLSPGGGIHIFDGSARITRTAIANNEVRWANGFGGGIAVMRGDVIMSDCFVTGNVADGEDLGLGGGVYIDIAVESALIASTVMGQNTASTEGGGMYSGGGQLQMTNIVARGNQAPFGGGISIDAPDSNDRLVTIAGAVIDLNEATDGAGGGVLVGQPARVRMVNVTTVFNTSASGGAGMHADFASEVSIANSIIGASDGPDLGGPGTYDVQFSSVQDGADGRGNITDLPLFVDAAALNYRLSDVSPCIDAGNSAVGLAPPTDIVGEIRAIDDPMTDDTGLASIGRVIDMGAFEFQPPVAGPTCVADIVENGAVDFNDLLTLLAAWGSCP